MSSDKTLGILSPDERRLLYTFMPTGFDRDVMTGDSEALADLMDTIRRWWREYEAALEKRGRAGLEEEEKHLERRQTKIEEREEALYSSMRNLDEQLSLIMRARGMEEGESVKASELAEQDEHAADILRRRRRLRTRIMQASEEKSTVHVQRNVIANLYHRRENFGDTKMPPFIEGFGNTASPDEPMAQQYARWAYPFLGEAGSIRRLCGIAWVANGEDYSEEKLEGALRNGSQTKVRRSWERAGFLKTGGDRSDAQKLRDLESKIRAFVEEGVVPPKGDM